MPTIGKKLDKDVDGGPICECGNDAGEFGFTPCDEKAIPLFDVPNDWPGHLFICDKCGAIINTDKSEIVGTID